MAEKNKTTENKPVSQSNDNTMKMVQTAPVVTKLEFASDQNKKKAEKRSDD